MENDQMKEPEVLQKIHKLLDKLSAKEQSKNKDNDNRKKRKARKEVTALADEDFDEDDSDADFHPNRTHKPKHKSDSIVGPVADPKATEKTKTDSGKPKTGKQCASFAVSLRENTDLITTALAGHNASKQQDTPFKVLGDAIKVLLTTEAKDVLSEAEVLLTFTNTGRLLHHHVKLLASGNQLLAPPVRGCVCRKRKCLW